MKKISFLFIFILLLFSESLLYAAEESEVLKGYRIVPLEERELPPGMDIIKVGTADVIAPKGTRVRKEGTVLYIESIGEYSGRKFEEIEERLLRIEAVQEELKEKLGRLEEELKKLSN